MKNCSCGTADEVAALRAEVRKLAQLGVTATRKGITLPEGSWVILPNGTAAQVGSDGVSYDEASVHNVNERGVSKAIGASLAKARKVPTTKTGMVEWRHHGNPHHAARRGAN